MWRVGVKHIPTNVTPIIDTNPSGVTHLVVKVPPAESLHASHTLDFHFNCLSLSGIAEVHSVMSEGQPAVVQRPGDEAEHLLVANLDVAVTSDPAGDNRRRLRTVIRYCFSGILKG